MTRTLLGTVSLTLGLVAGGLVGTGTAEAAPAPVVQPPAAAVTADRLPTVQIDGVVWSQAVVGNTVYAGGKFTNARPAGAAPGTSLTRRNNLLAYDITTGNLNTAFVPDLNAQVLSVAASPDGSRVYVVGDFTTANGQARRRVAAYSTATGQLVTAFNPTGVSSQARAVIATNDTVYVGGGFQSVGSGETRRNLAAFRASDGGLLPWNPNADYTVWALGISGDGAAVFAGGSFQNVGGQAAYGLAKISGASGALDPTWRPSVRNAGPDAGITSLRVQGSSVYGTTWHFGPGGNLEGTFKVPVANSDVEWVTDCHGDNYASYVLAGIVYTAGHAHYCGNVGGGFPEYPTRRFQHSQAWVDSGSTGEILNDTQGYPNWHGLEPAPSMVSWLPEMGIGSFTQQYQAGWSITGTQDYLAYGGEFPSVNGVGQQGLVRFGRRPLAPAKEGPRFPNNTVAPRLVPTSTSTLRVTWPAGFDRDDYVLTYRVFRAGTGTPRLTTTANSNRWTLPALGFVDTGLTPGSTYSYRLEVSDPDGNTVSGASTSVTMPTTFGSGSGYAQTVRSNGARIYWPLNETAGSLVTDRAAGPGSPAQLGVTDGTGDTGVAWNQPGAIAGDAAVSLTDSDASRIYAAGTETAPDTFTVQQWIRTTSTRGGRIFGFGDLQTGNSGHRDRHVYMDNAGRLVFGVKAQNASLRTVTSPLPYNDGQWHLVSATMSPQGMVLYVDGTSVGQRTDTTQGESYLGYWRLGGDNLDGWPSRPTTRNFTGSVDEVAVYPTALSSAQVLAQFRARNATPANQPPTAAFTATTSGLTVALNGSGSTDSDGTVTGWAWTFGDQTSGTGATTSHTYGAAGTYPVSLTVTDNGGAKATSTQQVTVGGVTVVAADTFERTSTGSWGSAEVGGAWTPAANASLSVGGGAGRVQLAAGTGPTLLLSGASARDVDLTTSVSFDKAGTGSGVYTSAIARRIGTSDYRLKIRLVGSGATLYLNRTVDAAETVLSSQAITGLVVSPGDVLNLRLQVSGAGTTTLRGKVWPSGTAEPQSWTLTSTDTTAALQSPGTMGINPYLSGAATNAPITVRVLDFQVR